MVCYVKETNSAAGLKDLFCDFHRSFVKVAKVNDGNGCHYADISTRETCSPNNNALFIYADSLWDDKIGDQQKIEQLHL